MRKFVFTLAAAILGGFAGYAEAKVFGVAGLLLALPTGFMIGLGVDRLTQLTDNT